MRASAQRKLGVCRLYSMETGLKKQLQTAACEYETHTATLCIMLFKFFSSAILVLGNFKFVKIVQQNTYGQPSAIFSLSGER